MLVCMVCRTRARAGPAPSGAIASKKRAVPMSPATGAEGPVAKRTRSALTMGKAFSPGGTCATPRAYEPFSEEAAAEKKKEEGGGFFGIRFDMKKR